MIFTLAVRNLFHDSVRFVATVVGIVFSIVLVTVQLGLYLGFERLITSMIDHASADLWIVPRGTKSFEDASLLGPRERYQALPTPGIAAVTPILVGFAEWRRANGGSTPVVLIGSDPREDGLRPWNVVAGNASALSLSDAVAVDRSYFDSLGVSGPGDQAQIEERGVRVVAVTEGIRSFTTAPYVFTSLDRARSALTASPDQASYLLAHLAPGADVASVRRLLAARLVNAEVLTRDDFVRRSRTQWLFGTGAGAALLAGALLGIIVGTVIVAQTLYSSTKDYLAGFATLRALGSSAGYINKVILCQAFVSAVIGFGFGAFIGFIIVAYTADTALPVVITGRLMLGLFALTLGMCAVSALAAIVKVTRVDPAMVLNR